MNFQMAQRCASAFSRHDLPEVCINFAPSEEIEGAGKTGCALHPRSRVQFAQRNAHTSIQVQRKHSGLPRAMVLRLIACSPWRPGFLATVAREKRLLLTNLTPASGCRDHTTSPYATACVRLSQVARPPHLTARFVTIASRPSYRVRRTSHIADLPDALSGIFLQAGLDDPNHFEIASKLRFCAQSASPVKLSLRLVLASLSDLRKRASAPQKILAISPRESREESWPLLAAIPFSLLARSGSYGVYRLG